MSSLKPLMVAHAVLSHGHHSDFLHPSVMPNLFAEVWQSFLNGAEAKPTAFSTKLPDRDWKQAWWPFRATVFRIFMLSIASALITICAAALILGAIDLWSTAHAALAR
ncbi:MAG TPA: hypothetical protein VHQ22_20090 [Terriglobales bacterium]|jgi:hypothetical protein|nr:hypothetical protein [Terriglobales bacterium]